MFYNKCVVFVLFSNVFFNLSSVSGIRCFQCNSNNNSDCFDLKDYGKTQSYIQPTLCTNDFGENPFCRKTVLKVLDKSKRVEERVIRSCGWIPYKRECYKTDNEGHQEKVCQCFEDGCNSSILNKPASLLIPFMIIALAFCRKYNAYGI